MNSREATALLSPWRTLHLVAAALCARVPRNSQIDGNPGDTIVLQERRALACLHLLHLARTGAEEVADWQLCTGEAYTPESSILSRLPRSESRELAAFAHRWLDLARHILKESVDALYDAFEELIGDLFNSRAFLIGDIVLCSLQVDESFRTDLHTNEVEQGIGSDRMLQRRAQSGGSVLGAFVRRCLVAFESLPFEAVVQLHERIAQQQTIHLSVRDASLRISCDDVIAMRRAAHRAVRAIVVRGGPPHPRDIHLLEASKDPAAELFRWVDAVHRNNINKASFALRRYYDLAVARCSSGMHDSGPQEAAIAMASMFALMGQPLPAMTALEESIRVAQQTGDYVSLTKALAWMSRLATDENQRLQLLQGSRDRAPRLSQERMLSHLLLAQTLMNLNFPVTIGHAVKQQKWRRVLEHINGATKAMVNPAIDMHLVFASMYSLAVLSGQPTAVRESLTEMRLESLTGKRGERIRWTECENEGITGSSLSDTDLSALTQNQDALGLENLSERQDHWHSELELHPYGIEPESGISFRASCSDSLNSALGNLATAPLTVPTEHLARALCALSADTLMRRGVLRGMQAAALPLLDACDLVRKSDETPESSPVLRILHCRLARLVFEFALARHELRVATVALERLLAYAPPLFRSSTHKVGANSSSLDALNAKLDALESQSRLWLAREQAAHALGFAEEYATIASRYATAGCRSRQIDALLLQAECYLYTEMNARALTAALASISLAESLGDEPRRHRAILALAEVRLAMMAAEHVAWLLESADPGAQTENMIMNTNKTPLWRRLVHEESPLTHSERSRVWMLLGALELARAQRNLKNVLGGSLTYFEKAFAVADVRSMQFEALHALIRVRNSPHDRETFSRFKQLVTDTVRRESRWISAFLVTSPLEWERNLRCYFQQGDLELQDT
ncbi:hypothetical protein F1559_000187 [Cyanidiococcus yangmingshanensis]|uniref:Anaphase-promoting complex subunit 5 n=1 Tax=Cyanidiococcus yangmingshanensis TaxID=2690220 RepID=A0A7J7IE76_9RHOD|nr:hypothetical protein F1559_000187 [Cyanidiococcus yangmingshanensis]